mgnify:FL=1
MNTTSRPIRTGRSAAVAGRWTAIRGEWSQWRTQRAARNQLLRELDAYRTVAEIEDLLAAADRSESPEAEDLRVLLHARLAQTVRRNSLAA